MTFRTLSRAVLEHKLLVLVIVLVVGAGFYMMWHSLAATPFVATEPEAGAAKSGAFVQSDGQASGDKAVRFVGADPNFTSGISADPTTYSLTKGSYGSISGLDTKGYTKMGIVTAAGQAESAMADCAPAVDTTQPVRLEWVDTYCRQTEANWSPQGLTGIGSSGYAARSDILLMSLHDDAGQQGRLVLMNLSTKKKLSIYLVRPCSDASGYCDLGSTTGCVSVHVGGLAWYKNHLFAADSNCIMEFDVTALYRVSSTSVILPMTRYWHRDDPNFTLSGIGLDASGSTPQLIINESNSPKTTDTDCNKTHFARWDLDTSTETFQLDSGSTTKATSAKTYTTPICLVQGVQYIQGMYIFSTFHSGGGTDFDYRVRTLATAPRDVSFAMQKNNPEGIYIDTRTGLTWSMTELEASDGNTRVYSWTTASMLEYY